MTKRIYVKWLPVVNVQLCNGCNRCVLACGPASLELLNGVATLLRPDTCGSDGHCIRACREDAIRMEWMEQEGDRTRGKWGYGGRVWLGHVRGGHHRG